MATTSTFWRCVATLERDLANALRERDEALAVLAEVREELAESASTVHTLLNLLNEARKDRASIVAWVAGEGDRFRRAMSDGVGGDDRRERLAAQSGLCFTLSSQIARSDDKVSS